MTISNACMFISNSPLTRSTINYSVLLMKIISTPGMIESIMELQSFRSIPEPRCQPCRIYIIPSLVVQYQTDHISSIEPLNFSPITSGYTSWLVQFLYSKYEIMINYGLQYVGIILTPGSIIRYNPPTKRYVQWLLGTIGLQDGLAGVHLIGFRENNHGTG